MNTDGLEFGIHQKGPKRKKKEQKKTENKNTCSPKGLCSDRRRTRAHPKQIPLPEAAVPSGHGPRRPAGGSPRRASEMRCCSLRRHPRVSVHGEQNLVGVPFGLALRQKLSHEHTFIACYFQAMTLLVCWLDSGGKRRRPQRSQTCSPFEDRLVCCLRCGIVFCDL